MTQIETLQAIDNYNSLQTQIKELEEQLSTLKESIMTYMNDNNVTKLTSDNGVTASIVNKETFKYTDEHQLITTLKAMGLNQYIVEKINTSVMNKDLKASQSLNESLSSLYTKTSSQAFSVK